MKISLRFMMTLFMLGTLTVYAQRRITGKVQSAAGKSLSDVSITEKGKSNSSKTDASGNYSIQVAESATLIFKHIGFNTVERAIGNASVLNISLAENTSNIDEVVVTAYGVSRDKKSLGYSAPTVKGSEVAETQREGFFAGLQGRVPGLSVNSTNGAPGASSQIVLRGFVSISGDNNALIVIDGVPVDNSTLNEGELVTNGANRNSDYSNRALDINPEDIETYTILKGPEATAMFGNQGASGAIVITTKKAKAGKGSATYTNSFRWETLNRWPERQTEYGPGSGGVYNVATTIYQGPKNPEGAQIFDNIGNFFKTGFAQKHNLTFEGGSDKLSYRWSNEYTDNQGVIPNTSYSRISSRLNGTAQISEKIKLNTSFNYINSDNDKARKGTNGFLIGLLRYNPTSDVRQWIDDKGNRDLTYTSIYSEWDNPFWDVYKNTSYDKVNRLLANSNLQYQPTNWLTLTGILAIDYSMTHGQSVYHAQSYLGSGSAAAQTGGTITTYDRASQIINGSFNARSNHKFGDNFSGSFVLGASFDSYNYQTNSQYGERFFDPNFYSINNTLPTTQRAASNINRYRNIGFFGQAILGYQQLLYLTLSARVDGASRLMPSNPYFAYPSGSFAFNFTDLAFFKENVSWLSDGKLRSSIALTGKQPWKAYATGSNLAGATSTGGGYAYSYYGGNPDLKVETTQDFETGLEFALFKKRVSVDFTYYQRLSKDQIILPRLSYGSGFVLRLMNGGDVENKGIEVQLKTAVVRKEKFGYDITFNYTQNRGTVLSVAKELPELYDSDTWILSGTRTAVFPGASIGSISGTRFERNEKGDILINPVTGLPYTGDGKYYPIADRIPKFTLGMVNQLRYKNMRLSFLWDFRYGGDVLNGTEYDAYTRGISTKTLNREEPRVVTGVLKDGLENSANPTPNNIAITPYFNSLYYTTNVTSEMFVERNIKALRLRDVTFNYEFPKQVARKLGKDATLSAFVTATDLVLITNYSGTDPESNSNTASLGGVGGYGIDYGNIGKPIGFNIGLRLKL